MNQPSNNGHPRPWSDGPLLDRLVDGELTGANRRALLLRLDAQPDGWRRCALAFLESQTLSQALDPHLHRELPVEIASNVPEQRAGWGDRGRRWTQFAALAASLAAAFFMGRLAQPNPESPAITNPMAQTPIPSMHAQPDIASSDTRSSTPSGSPRLPTVDDAFATEWERKGFETETHERSVTFELGDGRSVELPVQEVRLRYVRDQVY